MSIPNIVAIPKFSIVPPDTHSFFLLFLNRSIDFVPIINSNARKFVFALAVMVLRQVGKRTFILSLSQNPT